MNRTLKSRGTVEVAIRIALVVSSKISSSSKIDCGISVAK